MEPTAKESLACVPRMHSSARGAAATQNPVQKEQPGFQQQGKLILTVRYGKRNQPPDPSTMECRPQLRSIRPHAP